MGRMMLALVPLIGGCAWFQGAKDTIEGVLEPVVAVGVVIQIDPVDDATLDGQTLDLNIGRAGTIFLADTRNISDLANAPVSDATVEVLCGDTTVQIGETAAGTYLLEAGTALDDCADANVTIQRTDVDPPLVAPIYIPDRPDFEIPVQHNAGEDLVLPLSTAGYDSALVVVIDGSSGDVTFSNEPHGITEYYQFLTGSGEVTDATIPGSAFVENSVHAVIVTGLVRTPNNTLEQANTALSIVSGGRGRVYAVSTIPPQP